MAAITVGDDGCCCPRFNRLRGTTIFLLLTRVDPSLT